MRLFKEYMVKLLKSERGAAAIEFAIAIPVLLFMFVGMMEMARYVLVHQKTNKAAIQIADFVSQTPTPQNITATQLRSSFDTLMQPFGTTDSGFVMHVIGLSPNEQDHIITHQIQSKASSPFGGVGSVVTSEHLRGINLRPRDRLIIVETVHRHTNLFGDVFQGLLSTTGNSESAPNIQDANIRKTAFFRYRFDLEAEEIFVDPQIAGPPPGLCGYYRDDDYDRDNPLTPKSFENKYFDIWPIGADDPHPCTCYPKEYIVDELKQALSTCRPQLLASPYNCARKPNCCHGANEWEELCEGCIKDNDEFQEARGTCKPYLLAQGCGARPNCCASATEKEKHCNGCFRNNDQWKPPINPNANICEE